MGIDGFSEADWEILALEALAEQGWEPLAGTAIAPGADDGRASWSDIVLPGRLLSAMRKLNPQVPGEYLQQAMAELLSPKSQDAITENYRLHEAMVRGYRGISYLDANGQTHQASFTTLPWSFTYGLS